MGNILNVLNNPVVKRGWRIGSLIIVAASAIGGEMVNQKKEMEITGMKNTIQNLVKEVENLKKQI